MARSSLKQLQLLLWKNYILHKRKWVVTLFEVLIPTVFSILLVLIRQKVETNEVASNTTWSAFNINILPHELQPSANKWTLLYAPSNNTFLDKVMHIVSKRLNVTYKGMLKFV